MSTEIIAEIGQNHNGDMRVAEDMIKAAKRAGADVAKFQVYDARALFPPTPAMLCANTRDAQCVTRSPT